MSAPHRPRARRSPGVRPASPPSTSGRPSPQAKQRVETARAPRSREALAPRAGPRAARLRGAGRTPLPLRPGHGTAGRRGPAANDRCAGAVRELSRRHAAKERDAETEARTDLQRAGSASAPRSAPRSTCAAPWVPHRSHLADPGNAAGATDGSPSLLPHSRSPPGTARDWRPWPPRRAPTHSGSSSRTPRVSTIASLSTAPQPAASGDSGDSGSRMLGLDADAPAEWHRVPILAILRSTPARARPAPHPPRLDHRRGTGRARPDQTSVRPRRSRPMGYHP